MNRFLLVLCWTLATSAYGGGSSSLIEILSLTDKGGGEYRLEYIHPDEGKVTEKNKKHVVYIRYTPSVFEPNPPSFISKARHDEALTALKLQADQNGKSLFGIMGPGLKPIPGRDNEYQVEALSILEEFNGRRVVYSFSKKP